MKDTEQAARCTGPIAAADATGRTGVMRIAFTGSAQTITLPTTGREKGRSSTLGKRWVRVAAVGAGAQWAFGIGSAPTINANEASAMGTGDVNAGATIFEDTAEHYLVPSDATHIGFIGLDSTNGYLEIFVSDQAVV